MTEFLNSPWISLLSLIIAGLSAGFTIKTHYQSKKDAYQVVASMLIEQKDAFLSGYASLCVMPNNDSKTYLFEELASNYCNAFESACCLYNEDAIDKNLFKSVFKDEIKSIVNGEGIAHIICINDEEHPDYYSEIRKAHEEMSK